MSNQFQYDFAHGFCSFCDNSEPMESDSENVFGSEFYYECSNCGARFYFETQHVLTRIEKGDEKNE